MPEQVADRRLCLIAVGRPVPILSELAVDDRTPIHAVHPQRCHLSAKVRLLIDFLVEKLRPAKAMEWPGEEGSTLSVSLLQDIMK